MQFTDHAEMVRTLAKDGVGLLGSLTPQCVELWHHLTGMVTEVGEIATAVKANVIYGKDLDRANLVEELGDLEFYMEGLRQVLKITREETIQGNLAKLSVRYSSGAYSNEQAIARADKRRGGSKKVFRIAKAMNPRTGRECAIRTTPDGFPESTRDREVFGQIPRPYVRVNARSWAEAYARVRSGEGVPVMPVGHE